MSFFGPSMEDLPEHVMVDILSRLPVKIIIHCKCVCKKWMDLLSDSYFARIQLLRSPAGLMIHHNSVPYGTGRIKPGILKWVEIEDELDHHQLHHDPLMSLDLDLAPIFHKSQIHQVGSVNGLICLRQFASKNENFYICNPITREYMILPRPRHYGQGYTRVYCFGVGSLTHEYKLIWIFQADIPSDTTSTSQRPSLPEAEVYTLGTGQWKSLGHVPYSLMGHFGPFLNDHAHWIVVDEGSPEKICAFDFDKETFELFPSPPSEEERQIKFQSLRVVKGCLCRCDLYDSELVIWVMKEYGIKKSWCKEVVIKESVTPNLDLLMLEYMNLIEGLKDGTILVICCADELLAYCPQRKTIVDTKIIDRCYSGLAYRPSFHRLHNFKNERVHVF